MAANSVWWVALTWISSTDATGFLHPCLSLSDTPVRLHQPCLLSQSCDFALSVIIYLRHQASLCQKAKEVLFLSSHSLKRTQAHIKKLRQHINCLKVYSIKFFFGVDIQHFSFMTLWANKNDFSVHPRVLLICRPSFELKRHIYQLFLSNTVHKLKIIEFDANNLFKKESCDIFNKRLD